MYDIREFFSERKTDHVVAVVGLVVFVVGFVSGYMLGLRNVSDHGGGVGEVGNQLEQTGTAIQHAKDGIDAAAGTADQIGAGIGAAKESAGKKSSYNVGNPCLIPGLGRSPGEGNRLPTPVFCLGEFY